MPQHFLGLEFWQPTVFAGGCSCFGCTTLVVNDWRKGVLSLLLLAATTLVGQQNTATPQQEQPAAVGPRPARFLLRVARLDMNSGHQINECILLLPGGHYRREYSEEQPTSFSRTPLHKSLAYETHVFEGQLSLEEVAAVNDIISQPDFRAIRSPDRLHLSPGFFQALVMRQGQPKHSFLLSEAADYKPNKRALKPLFDWMRQMTKRKHDVSESEGNACRIPKQVQWSDREREPAPTDRESVNKPH